MNFKIVFPWILVLALLADVGFQFTKSQKQEKELAQLREEISELPKLRVVIEEAKKQASIPEDSISDKERSELIRLRNEVGVLRHEKQQLTTQVQSVEKGRQELLEKQTAQQAQQIQQLQQFAQETQEQKNGRAREICINNLRQIDGAKQQWALENKQPADAVVVMQQILPYLSHNGTPPVCPSGGVYTLNSLDAAPTCSIAGHSLPQ